MREAASSEFKCLFTQHGILPEIISNPISCESSFSGLGEPLGFLAAAEEIFSQKYP